MATIKVDLLDERDEFVASVVVESSHQYVLNDYFDTDDGGVYLDRYGSNANGD